MTRTAPPIVFIDTETTGLRFADQVWEVAALRVEPDGAETELHLLVMHNELLCEDLPHEPFDFHADHHARYPHGALPSDGHVHTRFAASRALLGFLQVPSGQHKPHLVGAVVSFDADHLRRMLLDTGAMADDGTLPWHYHVECAEVLARGYLLRDLETGGFTREQRAESREALSPPWKSEDLSSLLNVTVDTDTRHQAMSDVLWAKRIYDACVTFHG